MSIDVRAGVICWRKEHSKAVWNRVRTLAMGLIGGGYSQYVQ